MKKNLRLFSAFLILFALCISIPGTASASSNSVAASDYLTYYYAWTGTASNGTVYFYYNVDATGWMDLVGASCIVVQQKISGTWSNAATYIGTVNNGMLREDATSHTGSLTYSGISGREYRAIVTFYAGDGSGYDTRNYTTVSVIAP